MGVQGQRNEDQQEERRSSIEDVARRGFREPLGHHSCPALPFGTAVSSSPGLCRTDLKGAVRAP
jgi:hypothetical protein